MTDPPPATDPSPIGAHQITEDGRIRSIIYWQRAYQLGRYDRRITDLQEARAWVSERHNEATDASHDALQRQLDQLQADLPEADCGRATHLDTVRRRRAEILVAHGGLAAAAERAVDEAAAAMAAEVGPELAANLLGRDVSEIRRLMKRQRPSS